MRTRRGTIKSLALAFIATALASGAIAKSCLWKISSGKGTLYLQGSVHVLKADSYPLDPAIEKAYAASDVLVLETDIKAMSSPETQARIMKKAMLSKGQTLETELNKKTFKKFEKTCAETNLPIAALQHFRPWFASMTLAMLKMQEMGFDPEHGLDKYFHGKATTDGKKVVGLETIDFQIQLLASLDKEDPNQFVSRSLDEMKMLKEDVNALDKAWKEGDIDTLGKLLSKGFKGYPDAYKRFITDRNAAWFKTLDSMLANPETPMVVVGAGHLPGKGGLLELFKKKGYTVEQL